MLKELIEITTALRIERYSQSKALFLAGSIVRGEGTSTSDLDLVVVFDRISAAYRDSYIYKNWPVEAFVHDPQTLEYFFRHVDRPSGVPSLPRMVSEGVEIPGASSFTNELKQLAHTVLEEGPPTWSSADIDRSRYAITDLIDDLRDPRSVQEAYAISTALYPALTDHYFRSRQLWSAKGKAIPRRLSAVAPEMAEKFAIGFEPLLSEGCAEKVIGLAEEILEPRGGYLFEGYKLEAPELWRVT